MRASAAIPLLALLAAGCSVLDPMMEQQKVKPYRESDFFGDGISMRPAPEGAVSTERVVAPEVAAGRNPDGTPVARIPIPVTRQLLETGRKRFEIVCGTCHGLLGDGKSLVARNMSLRPPPSLHDNPSRPDGYYYQVVSQGFGLMASYAGELDVEERWAVVAYLRALQLSQRARLALAPPEVRARLEKEAP
jgi:mono/diheme cytochrome c family protein